MANILSKTGITTSNPIETWQISQSIDAFTGTAAYDITLSGSLELTGSVNSLNGFTGNLNGTASYATPVLGGGVLSGSSQIASDISGSFIQAEYLTLAENGNLTNGRILTAGSNITFTDLGAGSTLTLNGSDSGVTSVTGTSPVVSSGGNTPAISMAAATTSTNGYLTSTDWNTFNGKQGTFELTTVGTSGSSTFNGSTLNIPNYAGGGGGIGGSITSTQVSFGAATTDEIEGEAAFTYNKTTNRLFVANVSTTSLTGSLSLTGTILPNANSVYDIGSAALKIRDIYLSDTTLYFGTSSLAVTDNVLSFKGSTTLANSISGNATTATTATNATNATNVITYTPNEETTSPYKHIVGKATFSSGNPVTISSYTTLLAGKTMGGDLFITTGFVDADEPTSISWVVNGGGVLTATPFTNIDPSNATFMYDIWFA